MRSDSIHSTKYRTNTLRAALVLISTGILAACGGEAGSPGSNSSSDDVLKAASTMTAAGLAEHIRMADGR